MEVFFVLQVYDLTITFHEFLFQIYSKEISGILSGYKNVFMMSKSSKNCFVCYHLKFLILAVSLFRVMF